MGKQEIARKFDEIVGFAELEKFIDTPVKHYSSGMYVRLAFAVAAHLEPEILLVDEVLAVGDFKFQKKCLGKMGDVARAGRTVILVSHNLGAICQLCPRTLWIEEGSLVADGDSESIVARYMKKASNDSNQQVWERTGNGHVKFTSVEILTPTEILVRACRWATTFGSAHRELGSVLAAGLTLLSNSSLRLALSRYGSTTNRRPSMSIQWENFPLR